MKSITALVGLSVNVSLAKKPQHCNKVKPQQHLFNNKANNILTIRWIIIQVGEGGGMRWKYITSVGIIFSSENVEKLIDRMAYSQVWVI